MCIYREVMDLGNSSRNFQRLGTNIRLTGPRALT